MRNIIYLRSETIYSCSLDARIVCAADKTAGTLAPVAVITPNRKAGMAASDNENIERTFTIKPLDLADAVIKEIPDQKFKGEPVVPTPNGNCTGEKSVLYLIK